MGVTFSSKRPERSKQLYEAIFENNSDDAIIEILSDGIKACYESAKRLRDDARKLIETNSFPAAGFLVATADEEIAKIYILMDMARLKFSKHESILRRLCRAFYDHLDKHIYFQIGLESWNNIAEIIERIKIERSHDYYEIDEDDFDTYEALGPPIPNQAATRREWRLYVDYSKIDKFWTKPILEQRSFITSLVIYELRDTESLLKLLDDAYTISLFDKDCLIIFHEEFSKVSIKPKTTNEQIEKILQKIIMRGVKLPSNLVEDISILKWPLYSIIDI